MPTLCKTALIACLVALSALAFAADNAPEKKPAEPPAAAVAPSTETAQKPATTMQPTRIGSVDITRIAAESERGKALKELLTAKKDKLQGKIDGKKKQVEKLKASIEAKLASMTPQQREAKSKEFQKKLEELQKFARTSEEELFSLQDKESKALYEAVEKAATTYGKANGFAAIVIKKELLYVGSSVEAQDVTDALITALNQENLKK
jgi:outer membrane protein